MTNTFCPLPWIHIATRPNGDVRVCCTANASGAGIEDIKDAGLVKDQAGNIMNLQKYTLEQVWNSTYMKSVRLQMLDGQIPASCTKCFKEEEQGIVSKRQWESEIWKDRLDINNIVSKTDPDGSLPVDIPYFDLRLGNLCQLKCIMCSPHDSSSWIKEWKIQYPKYKTVELKQDQTWDIDFNYTWYQNSSFLESMRKQSHNIKELYFAGGEPLLIPEHYKILEFMIETGCAKNCILRYNSNGLELPEKLFELWTHFKEVKFNFSVDAVGERNDYIRYPSKWENVVANLHRLDDTPDNITVNIACAVQVLNVMTIPELVRWKESKNFKKINLPPYGAGLIGTHLVYLPSYLNVRVLPKHLKDKVSAAVDYFCSRRTKDIEFSSNPYGLKRWQGLIKYMMAEDWSHKIPTLLDYLETTDQTRGTDFRKTFEELKNL
jgi:hypothetical protein